MSKYTQEEIDGFRKYMRTYKESGSRSINDLSKEEIEQCIIKSQNVKNYKDGLWTKCTALGMFIQFMDYTMDSLSEHQKFIDICDEYDIPFIITNCNTTVE